MNSVNPRQETRIRIWDHPVVVAANARAGTVQMHETKGLDWNPMLLELRARDAYGLASILDAAGCRDLAATVREAAQHAAGGSGEL